MADLELNPNFVRACNELYEAFGTALVRAMSVQALMFGDMLAGRPTREIPDYLRQLGVEQPEHTEGASDAR